MKAPHAFAAAENRIDRGRTKERAEAQRVHFAAVAKSVFDGVLGGYGAHLHADAIDALLREGAARRKAASDGPALSGVLGAILGDLCREIPGPKAAAIEDGNKLFKREGA